MREKRVFFDCGEIKLEGVLTSRKDGKPSLGAIVCHPHPQYGGNMNNNVVLGITRTLSSHGFATLRFNFRGAGSSGGSHGGGTEELRDVKSAIDFLYSTDMVSENSIFLVGYSFGAAVGLPIAVEDDRVMGWIGISPPVSIYDFGFLRESYKPKLLLYGDSDYICPNERVKELYMSLEEPKSIHVIADADHFLWGKEDAIAQHIVNFMNRFNQ